MRQPTRRQATWDIALAVGATVLLQLNVWTGQGDGEVFDRRPVSSLLMLMLTVPLVWRRRWPLAVALANGVGRGAQAVVTASWVAGFGIVVATLVALYSVGAYSTRVRGLVGYVAIVGALVLAESYAPPATELDWWNAVFFYMITLLAYGIGLYVRSRRRADELQRRARELEAERVNVAAAVREERAQIARELHDVVSHSVSASVVQAEAADAVLEQSPELTRRALGRIQENGRESLVELRRMLGILRADDQGATPQPQPRLEDLVVLVGGARADGLPVTLSVTGTTRPLPPGVELSAYRIVQESLTNARKHAGDCSALTVEVTYRAQSLDLAVTDDGRPRVDETPSSGHGLIGMSERVAFLGGTFSALPGPRGGFRVEASLPVPSPPAHT